ncbi:Helix-turn-helix domain protein [Lacunisphaera limnophila]|uniref:Helix-turn-helix domain protein n=1 Tax=Lacunisphaera limnophila TaxID=1838286 RepID=A0A1D8AS63_9BACT|nr:helix-turn-helix domain-containing protein [Lacunisphaera limnophila]AOS43709.1 Helix-turn-helix domain protein [Lacunisphaera limnophila]
MSTCSLPNGDEFFLLPEIAEALRCSVKTVRRLIQDGKLKSSKVRGRVVVLKSAFLAYLGTITTST